MKMPDDRIDAYKMRLMRAERENPHAKRMEEMKRRAEEAKQSQIREKQREAVAFHKWEEADTWVMMLETTRDRNQPESPNEEWTPLFCAAIQLLPEAKKRSEDLWYEYVEMRGGG